MSNNKPLIAAILTIVILYLLVSFAIWDLNAKHWQTEVRVMYAFWGPIFSVLVYSGVKLGESNK